MGQRYFWLLVAVFVPAAVLLHLTGAGPVAIFLVAAGGLIPLAALLGRATEDLAEVVGPQLGGVLSATFGNAAELILGLVALDHGLLEVVKASITGSIIGNGLLVLGMSLLVGGLRNGRQSFDRVTVGLQSNLLVLAAVGLAIPTLLAREFAPPQEERLSLEVAGVLLATYLLNLLFSVLARGRPQDVVGSRPTRRAKAHPWRSVGIMAVTTALVVLLSEVLVGAIEDALARGVLQAWGMSQVFLGVVVVAVVGNAAENSMAVVMAYRNKADLALNVAVGSSLQIALLVMPLLVIASLWLGPHPLDLHFSFLELLAVGASVVVVALVAADGQGHWMEGVLLLAVYLILALAFFHLPAPSRP